ncbi:MULTISPECIES: hypothetical protein [unclassified Sutcliffiella]|uniref:hypothetical protein n=1 Tax=unclassified Sutcliffiella TaxID=2837532 RepID=UPI0030CBADB3
MGKAKWITIIIFSFLLSACTPNESISLEGSLPPLPTVSIDGNEVNIYRGDYCWFVCTDDESIVEKVKTKKHSQVAKNSPISIGFASELKQDRIILLSKGQDELALSEHPLVLEVK